MRFALRVLAGLVVLILVVAAVAGGWFWKRLEASKPQLEGEARLAGLEAAVRIERDALGVPTIHAGGRLDSARALGFLHAQDRFFQMDLLRRRATGELAELVGASALPLDRANRRHEFRRYAEEGLKKLPPGQIALATAYAEGVNAGLGSLRAPPWEYALLRSEPKPWAPVDCVLTGYAMVLELQDPGNYERALAVLRDIWGSSAVGFFAPLTGPDDAAADGSKAPLPPIPAPYEMDLRTLYKTTPGLALLKPGEFYEELAVGSNAFAVAGDLTATGAALLANDMHLGISVPNTWYRVVLRLPTAPGAAPLRLAGVTLPGSPILVAGSNGSVAWGMTNSYVDTADLVRIAVDPLDPGTYRTPSGYEPFEWREQLIAVRGGPSETLRTQWTRWGPVVVTRKNEPPLALAWTAHSPLAMDLGLEELLWARSAAEGADIAARSGGPSLNMLTADKAGAIAWTISGPLPRRIGYDGRLPASRSYDDRRWEGFLPADQHPRVLAPASGYLCTTNERAYGGDILKVLGDGGYESPYRSAQARGDLEALTKPGSRPVRPADLLGVQLDDRALFLERWRALLLSLLTPETLKGHPGRAELRALVENWGGRAAVDSAGYRLVRDFRGNTAQKILYPIFEPCLAADSAFSWRKFHYEPALWRLIEEQPPHLLSPAYRDWDHLLLSAVDLSIEQNRPLEKATWGRRNTTDFRHPLARLLPSWLTGWLAMPHDQVPGDRDMPRVGGPVSGASERFTVSPGREEEGLFHMPCGQSAHPLSPFFRAGHEAWVKGSPTPFLPGPTAHTLNLTAK